MQASQRVANRLGSMPQRELEALLKEIKNQPAVYDRLLAWQEKGNRVRQYRGEPALTDQQMVMRMVYQYLLDKELEVMQAAQA